MQLNVASLWGIWFGTLIAALLLMWLLLWLVGRKYDTLSWGSAFFLASIIAAIVVFILAGFIDTNTLDSTQNAWLIALLVIAVAIPILALFGAIWRSEFSCFKSSYSCDPCNKPKCDPCEKPACPKPCAPKCDPCEKPACPKPCPKPCPPKPCAPKCDPCPKPCPKPCPPKCDPCAKPACPKPCPKPCPPKCDPCAKPACPKPCAPKPKCVPCQEDYQEYRPQHQMNFEHHDVDLKAKVKAKVAYSDHGSSFSAY